jgi:hypothetical protein
VGVNQKRPTAQRASCRLKVKIGIKEDVGQNTQKLENWGQSKSGQELFLNAEASSLY